MTHDNITPFEEQFAHRAQQLDLSPPPGMEERVLQAAASAENAPRRGTRGMSRRRGMVGVAAVVLALTTSIVGTAIAGQSVWSPGLRDTMSSYLGLSADDVQVNPVAAEDTDQGVTVSASGVFNNGVLVAIAIEAHDPAAPDLVHQINAGLDDATGEFAETSLRTEDGQMLQYAGLAADPDEYSRMLVLFGTADGEAIEAENFVLDVIGAKRYASNQLVDEVDGEWTLDLSIPQTDETQNLAALDPGTVGPVAVEFGAFKHSEAFIGGSIHLNAPTAEDLAPDVSDELQTDISDLEAGSEFIEPEAAERAESDAAERAEKLGVDGPDLSGERAPGIWIDLFGPDGEHVNPIYTSGLPTPGDGKSSADVVAFWPRGESGTYRLVISYDGDTAQEWDLQIP